MKLIAAKKIGFAVQAHEWHALWNQVMVRLDTLTRRVNEVKDIQAASEFARWLRMSGLVKMFRENPQPPPLEVDGARVEAAIVELIYRCAEQWSPNAHGMVEVSEVETINRKLDVLATALASVSVSPPATLERKRQRRPQIPAALRVLARPGGA